MRLARIFLSFFFVGKLPAGGTIASIITSGIIYIFKNPINEKKIILFAFFIFLSLLSFLSLKHIKDIWREDDPKEIVMDEVLGMIITMLFIPINIKTISLGLIIFRFLDILKIFPINKIEKSPYPYSIFLDDIAAGILSNIILKFILINY